MKRVKLIVAELGFRLADTLETWGDRLWLRSRDLWESTQILELPPSTLFGAWSKGGVIVLDEVELREAP